MNFKLLYTVALFSLLSILMPFVQANNSATAPHNMANATSGDENRPQTDAHIIGHIISARTGEHVPYVTVQVKNTMIGTVADGTGHYRLGDAPLGKHILMASFSGYITQEIEVDIIANETLEINFTLEDATHEVGEIVVSANRGESNRLEAASIVNVLSPKKFEQTTSCSMADAMNFQTGLRVENDCSNCGTTQLKINGFGGQYSQILIDSRPIYSSLASVYGLEQLPTDMIERVEVVKGGGSALYGANAIAGVVNIITKEPVRNSASLSNTSQLVGGSAYDINTALNASLVSSNNKAGVYIFGVARQRSPYDRNKDGFTETPMLNSNTIGFRGYYKTGLYSKITLEYHHTNEYRRGGDSFDKPVHQSNIGEELDHRIHSGGLRYDWFSKNARHFFTVYTSMQNISRDSYFGTHQNPDAFGQTKDFVIASGGMYRFKFNKCLFMPAELTTGVEHTFNNLHDVMLGYNRDMTQKINVFSGYAQNEWKNKLWTMLVGFRLDKHSMMKNVVFSPRVNFRYTPFNWFIARASYASGFRAPQAYDEDLHIGAVGGEVSLISMDPNLKPEYSHSVNASVDLVKTLGRVQTNLTVEGFYTNLNNVFVLSEIGYDTSGNLLLERQNSKGAYIAGLNLTGKLSFMRMLNLELGYTYQQSRYKEDFQWSDDVAAQRKMFRSPDHYGYLTLGYVPITGLDIALTGTYTGSMLMEHYAGYIEKDTEVNTQAFFDMGIRIAYDIKLSGNMKLQVNGGVKNILDSFQKDMDYGIDKDAGYIYGPAAPRSFFLGLKFMM